jgi:type IV pilus assembly protein PilE
VAAHHQPAYPLKLTMGIKMTFQSTHVRKRSVLPPKGFTLIELMIVVAIVGILAAVAYPSYTESVHRGDRSAARAALLDAQQFMERYYAANSRYSVNADGTGEPPLPARLQSVPTDSPKYMILISAVSTNTFTLLATPIGTDKCGNLSLTNTGVKGVSVTDVTVQECWR